MQSRSAGIPLPREEMPDWLLPLRNSFLASLLPLGLKTGTVRRHYVPAIDWLCAEAGRRGLAGPDGVDEATLAHVREALPARLSAPMQQGWTAVLNRFIGWLVKEDAIAAAPQPPEPAPTAIDALCMDYGAWLRTHCGSAPSTIKERQGRLRNFLRFRFGDEAPGDLNAITRADIVSCFGSADETGLAGARSKAVSLRSLFRFLFATGRTERNLALCVPSVFRPQSPAPTRHLSREEVDRVLAAARGDSAIARRDHAMLLAMARLGLRGQEVIAVRLDDIDWEAGEILIRGKRARQAAMPVPVDVGEAMAGWIRHGRRGSSRHLFVRVLPPFLPFASSDPVKAALHRACAASGVTPPGGEVRCHVFRHSLAMSLLQDGMPLADIGNLLRHESAETTTVYARHDIEALRPLARPWPVSQPMPEAGS